MLPEPEEAEQNRLGFDMGLMQPALGTRDGHVVDPRFPLNLTQRLARTLTGLAEPASQFGKIWVTPIGTPHHA